MSKSSPSEPVCAVCSLGSHRLRRLRPEQINTGLQEASASSAGFLRQIGRARMGFSFGELSVLKNGVLSDAAHLNNQFGTCLKIELIFFKGTWRTPTTQENRTGALCCRGLIFTGQFTRRSLKVGAGITKVGVSGTGPKDCCRSNRVSVWDSAICFWQCYW